MPRYHCPYCSRTYHFQESNLSSTFLCEECGDSLIKIPLIETSRLVAIAMVLVFVMPLLLMVLNFYQENKSPTIKDQILTRLNI